jgi:hypothetical protein
MSILFLIKQPKYLTFPACSQLWATQLRHHTEYAHTLNVELSQYAATCQMSPQLKR